jgi:programmed cell death protein 5
VSEALQQDELARQYAEMQKKRQMELQLKALLKQVLEPAAYERLSNIRLSNPELYAQLSRMLLLLYEQGRLAGRVSEQTLLELARKVLAQRRETTIKRI